MLTKSEWPADYREQFWEAYPRRIAKRAAFKVLERVCAKEQGLPFEVLLSAVKVYARSVAGKDMQYVAHPATWLNAGRWDDDPAALGGKAGAATDTLWRHHKAMAETLARRNQ